MISGALTLPEGDPRHTCASSSALLFLQYLDAENFEIALIQNRHMPLACLGHYQSNALCMFFSGGQVWKFDTDVIIKSVTVNYWKVEAGHLTR
ncbi:MAG: hypothetical protein NT113_02695 [Hyphomicrobiales bacterium]|nr:hypothetical protein [Hyphomicrobiales bacterium]